MSMVGASFRQAGDAVVAVSKYFDAETMIVIRQLIEAAKQLVEKTNKFLCCALRGENCEADDIGEENRDTFVLLDVDLVKLPEFSRSQDVSLHLHRNMLR